MKAALADYPHVMALKDGRIRSDRFAFEWETVNPITRAFRRMVRTGDFDLCEIALTTLAQAVAHGKDLTGLPVVVMRGFHHGALVCPIDSPLHGPEDLAGKRIAVRAYSQTTGVWLRGILLEHYGVDHRSITWVTEEDAHVQEYADPPNVVRASGDLRTMLMNNEVDAAIALAGLDPARVRTVIPDADRAAAAWYQAARVYPANHVVCVKSPLVRGDAAAGAELFRLFTEAKAASPDAGQRHTALAGGDPLPYGLAENRRAIALCLRYAAEQGLVTRAFAPEDLFIAGG